MPHVLSSETCPSRFTAPKRNSNLPLAQCSLSASTNLREEWWCSQRPISYTFMIHIGLGKAVKVVEIVAGFRFGTSLLHFGTAFANLANSRKSVYPRGNSSRGLRIAGIGYNSVSCVRIRTKRDVTERGKAEASILQPQSCRPPQSFRR